MTDTLDAIAREMQQQATQGPTVDWRPNMMEFARRITALSNQGEGAVPFSTVKQVVRALTWIGVSTPESQEEQAARSAEMVSELCREVLAGKDGHHFLTAYADLARAVTDAGFEIGNEDGVLCLLPSHPTEADRRDAERLELALALSEFMQPTPDHDIQGETGLDDADCDRIAAARNLAVSIIAATQEQT